MESSSESDTYDRTRRYRSRGRDTHPRRSVSRDRDRADAAISEKIDTLANTLQDTSRNLHKVDRMLGQYRDHTDDQADAMATLRGNLEESIQQLQSQRLRRATGAHSASASTLHTSDLDDGSASDGRRYFPTSPLKDYGRSETSSRRRSRSATVRFRDPGQAGEQIHVLHQSLRDLRSDQVRLGDDMDREILQRNRADIETKRTLEDLSGHKSTPPREDPVSLRVERRLQEIENEMRSDRQALSERRRPEQRGTMSNELQEALRRRDAQALKSEEAIKSSMLRSESEKTKVELELERARRQLDQSEGGRDALLQEVEDMRAQLLRTEKERVELQREVSQLATQQRSRAEERGPAGLGSERLDLEREVQELRVQLSRNCVLSEMDDLRRTVERKERERGQLAAQVQSLSSDLERREQQQLRMLVQLKEIQARAEDCAAERTRGEAQLADSDRKREELRARAQEAVRQWKAKCKRLEHELEEVRDESRVGTDKTRQACKEKEGAQAQLKVLREQAEGVRRELAEVLGRLAQREEEVHRRDVELAETRQRLLTLEQEAREASRALEQEAREASRALEEEAERQGLLQGRLRDENRRLEERAEALSRRREQEQAALLELQGSVKALSAERAELSMHLAEEQASRKELQQQLAVAQEEKALLGQQLELERELHQRELGHVKAGALDGRAKQERELQETLHLYRQEREELEAHVRELKADAVADKDLGRALRQKLDKMKAECDKLADELTNHGEAHAQLRRKYQALKQELEEKVQSVARAEERLRGAAGSVDELRERTTGLEAEQEAILLALGAEVDSACHTLSRDSADKLKAISLSPGLQKDPHRWLAETKTKLQWLCEEVREREARERRMRRHVQQGREQTKALKQSRDSEQQALLDRITQQDRLLHHIHSEKRDLLESSRRKEDEMRSLQDRILDLEMSTRVALDHLESVPDKLCLLENFKDLEESQRQREVVEQRYAKYKEIVGDLQHQLEESKRRIQEYRDEKLDATSRSLQLAGLSSSLRGQNSFLTSSLFTNSASPHKLFASPDLDSSLTQERCSPVNGARSSSEQVNTVTR